MILNLKFPNVKSLQPNFSSHLSIQDNKRFSNELNSLVVISLLILDDLSDEKLRGKVRNKASAKWHMMKFLNRLISRPYINKL